MRATLFPLLLLASLAAGQATTPHTWTIDAAVSQVRIHVARSGLLRFAGHAHTIAAPDIAGAIRFEGESPERSSLHVSVRAAALQVDPEGEPPEAVPRIQATMLGPRVLDVERYPTITFESSSVTVRDTGDGRLDLVVTGGLTLHGVERRLDMPVQVTVGTGVLQATGTFTIKQTDFGIEPVTAGLGTVRVKDEMEVSLAIVARRERD